MANDRGEARAGGLLTRELALSLYLPAAILSMGTGIVAPVLPAYAQQFDVSFATAALVIIVHGYGALVATMPIGYMIDRFGRKPMLIGGPFLTAIAAILTAFAGSFEELLIYRFIGGASMQMWAQARLAMIADTGRDRERGKLITWMAGMQRFGMLFSPIIGGTVYQLDPKAPFIIHGILVLLVLLPIIKLAKETAPEKAATNQPREESDWRYLLSVMVKPQILFFLTAQMFANLTRGNLQGVLTLYVAFEFAKSPQTLGLMASGSAAIIIPITFVTGQIMDRYGRKMTVVPGFLGLAVFSFALAITAPLGISFPIFLALYYGLHASQGVTAGNMQVLGSDLAPVRARGRFFATQRLAGEVGRATSPAVFSVLSTFSVAAAFSSVGVFGLIVASIIAFMIKETVGRADRAPPAAEAATPAAPQEKAAP